MPRPRKATTTPRGEKRPVVQYTHDTETRVNNPPVGLVDAASDTPEPREKTYAYDPHLDPDLSFDQQAARCVIEEAFGKIRALTAAAAAAFAALRAEEEKPEPKRSPERLAELRDKLSAALAQSREAAAALEKVQNPHLAWAGKAERTSFEVPTVSLHVHERIDPRSILEAVRKKNGSNYEQLSLWNSAAENPPLRDAIEFYHHRHGWTNRLTAGDSLLVMNSLLEKEGMAGKVQMLFFDPPYGIRYGSNFQPFVNKRDVKDGKDEDLTAEPEMIGCAVDWM